MGRHDHFRRNPKDTLDDNDTLLFLLFLRRPIQKARARIVEMDENRELNEEAACDDMELLQTDIFLTISEVSSDSYTIFEWRPMPTTPGNV